MVRCTDVLLLLEHGVARDQPAVPQRMMQYLPLLLLEQHLSNKVVLCCPLPVGGQNALMEGEKQVASCETFHIVSGNGANTC